MAELDSIDYLFVAPSASVHRIQEAQTTIYHVLWELIPRQLRERRSRGPGQGAMSGRHADRRRRQHLPRRRRLRRRGRQPAGRPPSCRTGSRVADYGISGMHLAYDLADGYDTAILIDAAPRGGAPGTIYVIEPDLHRRPDAGDGRSRARRTRCSTRTACSPTWCFGMLGMLGRRHQARCSSSAASPPASDYGHRAERAGRGGGRRGRPRRARPGGRCRRVRRGHTDLVAKEWSYVPRHSR